MRWPFGPPHLTLKPSKKTKQEKKNKKNNKNTKKKQNNNIQPQGQEQSKQNRNKSNTKKQKQTQETQKHLNLPNPDEQQWATPEKTQKLGKTSIFNTFETMPDTSKTNLLILKPQKKQTQKTPFCHVQKQPTIFHKFSVFFNIQFLFLKSCVLLKTL